MLFERGERYVGQRIEASARLFAFTPKEKQWTQTAKTGKKGGIEKWKKFTQVKINQNLTKNFRCLAFKQTRSFQRLIELPYCF